jgi:hypothetical protein
LRIAILIAANLVRLASGKRTFGLGYGRWRQRFAVFADGGKGMAAGDVAALEVFFLRNGGKRGQGKKGTDLF